MATYNRKFILKTNKNIFSPNLKYRYFENYREHPFEPNTNDFSLVNAWWLAESSMLAYADKDFINYQISQAGINFCRYFDSPRSKCFVANTNDFTIVAFRGTATSSSDLFTNLIDNLSINMTDFKQGGKVHFGFYNAFKDIWDEQLGFQDYLFYLKRNNPDIKFWFTGHSLGAAIASLAASSFKYSHSLYTFAAPKVGNLAFRNKLKFTTYRIVNYNDFITLLPPSLDNKIDEEYVHHGVTKYIDKNKKLKDEIKLPDNRFTKSIVISSKIIDIVFDKNKSILTKIVNLKHVDDNKKSHSSPVTGSSRFLNKMKSLFLRVNEIEISNHAPIFYVIYLWNIYIQSL